MNITINDLTIKPVNINRDTFLSDWSWAMKEPMLPVLITAMGDVFAQGKSKAVYFIDVVQGEIKLIAEDGQIFQSLLKNAEFVKNKMFPSRIIELRNAGFELGEDEVYSYKKPLVLGGGDLIENIEVTDVSVHVSIHGQIHHQVKNLPPGTKITDIEIK